MELSARPGAGQGGRDRGRYLRHLSARGVENRPVVSGNFTRQPAIRLHGIRCDPREFPGAEEIGRRGFFAGLHTEPLSAEKIERLGEARIAVAEEIAEIPDLVKERLGQAVAR